MKKLKREIEWTPRIEQYGWVSEAVPKDLDEDFLKKIVYHEEIGGNLGYYEAFLKISDEGFVGGDLVGVQRVEALKAWPETMFIRACARHKTRSWNFSILRLRSLKSYIT